MSRNSVNFCSLASREQRQKPASKPKNLARVTLYVRSLFSLSGRVDIHNKKSRKLVAAFDLRRFHCPGSL